MIKKNENCSDIMETQTKGALSPQPKVHAQG